MGGGIGMGVGGIRGVGAGGRGMEGRRETESRRGKTVGGEAEGGDTLIECIDTGACNFSDLLLINITEIVSI